MKAKGLLKVQSVELLQKSREVVCLPPVPRLLFHVKELLTMGETFEHESISGLMDELKKIRFCSPMARVTV